MIYWWLGRSFDFWELLNRFEEKKGGFEENSRFRMRKFEEFYWFLSLNQSSLQDEARLCNFNNLSTKRSIFSYILHVLLDKRSINVNVAAVCAVSGIECTEVANAESLRTPKMTNEAAERQVSAAIAAFHIEWQSSWLDLAWEWAAGRRREVIKVRITQHSRSSRSQFLSKSAISAQNGRKSSIKACESTPLPKIVISRWRWKALKDTPSHDESSCRRLMSRIRAPFCRSGGKRGNSDMICQRRRAVAPAWLSGLIKGSSDGSSSFEWQTAVLTTRQHGKGAHWINHMLHCDQAVSSEFQVAISDLDGTRNNLGRHLRQATIIPQNNFRQSIKSHFHGA